MNFPYPLVSTFTSSFNTASYFSADDVNNYNQNTDNPDIFFGKSDRDVVEFSYFNTIGEQNGWIKKTPDVKYLSQVGIYKDVDATQFTYNYRKVKTNYIDYQNNFLMDVGSDLSSSNVFDGQHIVSYNFTRTVAGSQSYPLIISDISPSRTELKLIPTFQKQSTDKNVFYENLHYESFCRKLVLIEDVVELIATSLDNFNCEDNYKSYSQSNPSDITNFKNTFGFKSDAEVISLINAIYDGSNKLQLDLFNNTTIKNLFGVKNYIKYWLYTYSKNIVSFQELNQQIKYIVQKEYLNQLDVINIFNGDLTNNLQIVSTIVYDNFVQLVLNVIENVFLNKFHSYYKNALNFGNGSVVKFVDHSFSSKSESESKHIELLVKLDSPLSFDYAVKTKCWISNISIAPIVQNVILIPLKKVLQYKISGPDFSAKINNANKYGYNNIGSLDQNLSDTTLSQINIIDKLKNLNIDYSKFENFVIFSSAAIRIKIFKNKLESINNTNVQIQTLSDAATSSNTIISASYSSDIQSLQNSILSIQNSFDGYESYLYTDQSLIQGSLSDTNSNYHNYILDAENYDIQNIDSLVNNTPEYLKLNEDNNDYLLFLSMVGHHFDNIYQYIKSFPVLNKFTSSEDYLPDLVYYMLKTFGWNTSTDFANKSTLLSYASDSSVVSAKNKNEIIWKRILDSLPQIYKTKGTEECINLLLSCYGVPLNILTIREFGGNDIFQSNKTSYVYDAKYYFTKYQSGKEYVKIPYTSSAKSLEFTFKTEKSYVQNQRINLVTKDTCWNLSLLKSKVNNYGDIIFNIQNKSMKIENVPIFNGDSFYNVLLRRNSTSSFLDTNSNENYIPTQYDLVVKSYDGDREVFNHSSSIVLTKTYNETFSQDGYLYFGNYPTSNKNFTGLLDKINLIQNPISNEYFSEYSRNYNFYGNNDVTNTWNDLVFRYNFEYPINLASSSISRPYTEATVAAWGDTGSAQTTVPAGLTDVTAIAAGDKHTVALKSDGTVVAWGFNGYGQITGMPTGLTGVTSIAAGVGHTVALSSSGVVSAWGWNAYGQTTVPDGLTGVTAIAGGGYHTVALKSDGTVVAWGSNEQGQMTVPAGLTEVTAISAGDHHTVALKSDGTVVAWGDNAEGQTTVPAGLTGVTAISAGDYYTVALKGQTISVGGGGGAYVGFSMPAKYLVNNAISTIKMVTYGSGKPSSTSNCNDVGLGGPAFFVTGSSYISSSSWLGIYAGGGDQPKQVNGHYYGLGGKSYISTSLYNGSVYPDNKYYTDTIGGKIAYNDDVISGMLDEFNTAQDGYSGYTNDPTFSGYNGIKKIVKSRSPYDLWGRGSNGNETEATVASMCEIRIRFSIYRIYLNGDKIYDVNDFNPI